ncbi:hypothetical protein [Leifsonia sp. fls2-241-R2A-40a]|uniref:hypothetical protein n=1 Tax=Leifsonia sp. fls2-241-R2A-40a TaxID=3040290 RepID=UPI00254FA758|nr:hypothetical protein [Leifsonia sp. fls2-241-R2A-40a]
MSSRPRPATAAELLRAANSIAASRGWQVGGTAREARGDPGEEVRLLVAGEGLPGPSVLRLRVRPAAGASPPNVPGRQAARSEHLVGVVCEPWTLSLRATEAEAVVLGPAPEADLERLLRERGGLDGGEAATILLGVAAGIAALHLAGWSGPELSPTDIAFVRDGCPALDGLDALTVWTPTAAVADADAFHGLARTVCLRVADGSGMRLLAAVEAGLRRGRWTGVEESVLAAVSPSAVRLVTAEDGPEVVGSPGGFRSARTNGRSTGHRAVALLGRAMDALDGNPTRALTRRLREWMQRRPALVAAGLVPIVLAGVLVVVLPPAGGGSASAAGEARALQTSVRSAPPTSAVASPSAGSASASARSASPSAAAWPSQGGSPSVPAPSGSDGRGAAADDDPVDAARRLLDEREACFRGAVARRGCLDAVLDGTAALAASETAAVGTDGAAASRDYTGAQLSLVERWGGAALVSVAPDAARTPKSEPASLLLVRSEAGWRLRAVFP